MFEFWMFLYLNNYRMKFAIHNMYAYLEVTLNLKTNKYITNNEWNMFMDA
jgi:hypothetical protein